MAQEEQGGNNEDDETADCASDNGTNKGASIAMIG